MFLISRLMGKFQKLESLAKISRLQIHPSGSFPPMLPGEKTRNRPKAELGIFPPPPKGMLHVSPPLMTWLG